MARKPSDRDKELVGVVLGIMALEDLDFIYVLVPREDEPGERENRTIRQMSDRQFREWIVGMGEYHHVPVLPTLGRLGDDTRLNMVNYLIRKGVKIHRLPKPGEDVS